ncbi:snoRNA-binding rRNA-processing protein [Saccharomycopsis crataegensis]|uniref:SnoRNA-binding rRNA-processing protein n=1 Tax=Saccharomycopsis crataegensis TaxID=43959 RepID=A0AAV5QFG2_9ASCO|nr:snoRNA-binding rRNA-processing protein [Saccharomycopsis crataegensis]
MSSSKQRIQIVRNPVLATKKTPEQRYWRSFGNTQLVKEHNAITHITFNPASPHDIAVTSSTRIQVFSSKTRQVVKTFSRFKETAYSGEYRYDGKLLVAGDSSGLVQIFDAQNPRTLLVSIQASSYPTHVTKFHPSISTSLFTASDDKIGKIYDISQSQQPLLTLGGHEDYIRSGTFIKDQPNLIATGCYDGYIRVFDTRIDSAETPILKFNHDAPVEDILSINETSIVSGGSNYIKVWDLPSNKLTKKLSNFSKTVTTLSMSGDRSLLAGSLDGHVKIYDTSEVNWQVKFGWKFGSGVLSCGVSPDSKHFVAGLTSGLLSIRTKKVGKPQPKKGELKQEKSRAYAKMLRGSEYHGQYEHRIINDGANNAKKPQKYEKLLNSFQWSEAFDMAFQSGIAKDITLSILEELKKLGKIHIALSKREDRSLEPFLSWSIKHLDDIKCFDIVVDYLMIVIAEYGSLVEKSLLMEELFSGLKRKVDVEIEKSKEANKISGMLQLLTS